MLIQIQIKYQMINIYVKEQYYPFSYKLDQNDINLRNVR